ncbi:PREDICTED: uncharacterized protein LOC104727283 [Camelina sativa]|uniref:Uncharacterized protein LOC104727283 n=1 Tax=Camelina sativa TaxID=90675 RepID=A0ABM0UQQ1_CAMSA|nr:PREDICTED: uncharacterized protein LOC104727283 [Camelina sativa]
MPTSQHHVVRTDVSELKSQIEKKIGRVKTETYLNLLSKFLTLKISKSDFDKLIVATVKKENVSLHNALLRGILRNVCLSKTPPSIKNGIEKKKKPLNGFQSLCKDLPKSPRKGRTQRRFKDGNKVIISKGKSQITEVVSSSGRQQYYWSLEDGEEVDQLVRCWRSQPIEPPLGANFRDAVKKQHRIGTCCYSSGELPDSVSLKKKLEDGLGIMEEGLEVSVGFSNLLNAGLDVFLKRLIKPCLELAASRSRSSQGEVYSSAFSLVDLQVAMELNPSLLGEDWPAKLEKIRFVKPDLPADSDWLLTL